MNVRTVSRAHAALEVYLDRLTMHRLTMIALLGMIAWAVVMGLAGVLGYSWRDILGAAAVSTLTALGVNYALSRLLRAVTDPQSSVITGLIVAMLVPVGLGDRWSFLVAASAVAVASKYVVTVDKQHIFNPAALSVAAIPFLFPKLHATWWVGTAAMLPAVAVLGLLIVLKTRKADVASTFLGIYLLIAAVAAVATTGEAITALEGIRTSVVSTALVFFAFVIMTDPITIPSGRGLKHAYAALVAFLYATPELGIPGLAATPEIALCLGNAVSFIVRPKYRFALSLKGKANLAPGIWTFEFARPGALVFAPGQYMEWAVPHGNPDGRGQRRYFTIASSPTEDDLRVVMRVPERCSSYKRALLESNKVTPVVATRLAGDFNLPRDLSRPLALLAGGVGIAPFRSMAGYIVDNQLRCDIVLLYWCRQPDEFLFRPAFEATRDFGWRTEYLVSGQDRRPGRPEFPEFKACRISRETIKAEIPDFAERTFFISGSRSMVGRAEAALRQTGVRRRRIRKDYFDGLVDV